MVNLYRHIKPNGETFYIGIGKKKTRPFSIHNRNKYWHNTVNKYGYEVQILKTDLTWEEACELESILISYYGRKDLGLGPLVNMTDGGDGNKNQIYSVERREKMRISMTGKTHKPNSIDKMKKPKSKEHGNNISIGRIGKFAGANCNRSNVILDTETGVFYDSAFEASQYYDINYNTLNGMLNNRRKNKTNLIKI